MAWARHVPVLVIALLLLVVARQIWPYADVHDPVVEEGMPVTCSSATSVAPPAWSGWTTRPCSCVTATGGASSSFPHLRR